MMGLRANKKRLWTILAVFFAGMCLIRVLAVWADEDIEETYANEHEHPSGDSSADSASADDPQNSGDDDSDSADIRDAQHAEIRLSSPEDAASRVTDDEGQVLVPGAQAELAREQSHTQNRTLASTSDFPVPAKNGRGIASEAPSTEREAQPDESARDTESSQSETYQNQSLLTASAMEPPLQQVVKTEPLSNPASIMDQSPLPNVASRGLQEVSIIVTDTGFYPARVPVITGIPVKIYLTANTKQTSCFMLDEAGVKRGVSPGKLEEITFTPQGTGSMRFYCPMNSIEGYLVVKEAPNDGAGGAVRGSGRVRRSDRGVASDTRDIDIDEDQQRPDYNAPKNAAKLRALIED